MKIGFSTGRCIADIVNGVVDINDVLLIVARTLMQNEEGVSSVITQYHWRGTFGDAKLEDCIDVAIKLWRSGRIYEPRAMGQYVTSAPQDCLWMDLFPTAPTANEAVKNAWEQYRMLINMVEQMPETDGSEIQHGYIPNGEKQDDPLKGIDPAIIRALIV